MSAFRDITGQVFGRLTVVEREFQNTKAQKARWKCRCICGRKHTVIAASLISGRTQSCGCIRRTQIAQHNFIHGMAQRDKLHPLYHIWLGLRQRCFNPKAPNYDSYGGRGIKVCERWNDFRKFLIDMGERPSLQHSIDRIDNDGSYSPDNCRWATPFQQRHNQRKRRHRRMIAAFGKTLQLAEWAKRTGIHRATITTRLKAGWPPERALTAAR